MRFSLVLPVLQTTAMLLIICAPWNPKAHEVDALLAKGAEFKTWTLIPGPNAIDWAQGVNLPAAAVAIPAEFAIRKNEAQPNYKVRFFGF
jgi:hypothetical protein